MYLISIIQWINIKYNKIIYIYIFLNYLEDDKLIYFI